MRTCTPLLAVVTGLPCTGKTTISRRIAEEFRLPIIAKDDIKELLFDSLGWSDREWSRRISTAAMDLLYYSVELLLTSGNSLIAVSNFRPEVDAPRFRELGVRHPFTPLVVHCRARGDVLLERFKQRAASGERHPGHVDSLSWREFEPILLSGDHSSLDLGGGTVEIDTTDIEAIDYSVVFQAIRNLKLYFC